MKRSLVLLSVVFLVSSGCKTPGEGPGTGRNAAVPAEKPADAVSNIFYVGSSTVANFLHVAEPLYTKAKLVIDTVPESLGGERILQEGNADLAGLACDPSEQSLAQGLKAELIGTDALLVIVSPQNPVASLTLSQLRAIYTGEVTSWKLLGGADERIRPFMMAPESATRLVFQRIVLGGARFGDCEVVRPDSRMPMVVEAEPGGIGLVSYSFLCSGGSVRVLKLDGEAALPDNDRYPLLRPLHLLWKPGNAVVEEFVKWIETPVAQEAIEKCFGRRVKK